jgi:hypothetical protein
MRQLLSFLRAINGRPREKKRTTTTTTLRRRRLVQTVVELRVRMDCERCEREVKKALSGIRGWSGHPPLSSPLVPTTHSH